jgi:hypothetical protein
MPSLLSTFLQRVYDDDDDDDLAEKTEKNAYGVNHNYALNPGLILQEAFLRGKSASLMFYSETTDIDRSDSYEVRYSN